MGRGVFFLLLLASLVGCSASIDGGGGSPGTPSGADANFPHKVTGPDVEGIWTSSCLYDSFQSAYKIMRAEFKGSTVTRSSNTYSDAACTKSVKINESKGIFRWSEATAYGGYKIDYKFDLGNGWTSNTYEEVLLENGNLYLSEFRIGFGTIDKNFPMKKAGDTPAKPKPGTPAPAPAPAPPATSCANVSGNYYNRSFLNISQKECRELTWQPIDASMRPTGEPEVYVMDAVFRYIDSEQVKAYYEKTGFNIEVVKPAGTLRLEFRPVEVIEACGMGFSGKTKVLLRNGFINNNSDPSYCRFWIKS